MICHAIFLGKVMCYGLRRGAAVEEVLIDLVFMVNYGASRRRPLKSISNLPLTASQVSTSCKLETFMSRAQVVPEQRQPGVLVPRSG